VARKKPPAIVQPPRFDRSQPQRQVTAAASAMVQLTKTVTQLMVCGG